MSTIYGTKSAYLKTKTVKHNLGIASFTMPTNVYLALIKDDGNEVSGGSYARQQLSFGTESGGIVNSNTAESFTNMPACTVSAWKIYDASSSGNILYEGNLDTPVDVSGGSTFTIASGNIQVAEE